MDCQVNSIHHQVLHYVYSICKNTKGVRFLVLKHCVLRIITGPEWTFKVLIDLEREPLEYCKGDGKCQLNKTSPDVGQGDL